MLILEKNTDLKSGILAFTLRSLKKKRERERIYIQSKQKKWNEIKGDIKEKKHTTEKQRGKTNKPKSGSLRDNKIDNYLIHTDWEKKKERITNVKNNRANISIGFNSTDIIRTLRKDMNMFFQNIQQLR